MHNIDMMRSQDRLSHHESAFFQCGQENATLFWHTNTNQRDLHRVTRKRYIQRVVAISTAGIFILGLVIVLLSVMYSTSSFTGHLQNAIDCDNVSDVRDSGTKWPNKELKSEKDSKDLHHEFNDTKAETYYKFMMNGVEKAMSTSVDPCDDFYEYACGNWGIHNPSIHGSLRWTNFSKMEIILLKTLLLKLRTLTTSPVTGPPLHTALPSVQDLAVDYYKSCQNEELLSSKGVAPLKEVLQEMDQLYLAASQKLDPLHTFQKVLEFVHHKLNLHVLFSWKVEADHEIRDAMTIEMNVPQVYVIEQGIDLTGKEKLIKVYGEYAKTLLKLVGTFNNTLDNEVKAILELFKKLRPIKGSPNLKRMTIHDLNKAAPILDWQEYLNNAFNRMGTHITMHEEVLSQIKVYLILLSKHILSEISTWGLERLYVYLRWEVIEFYSQFLHKAARDTLLPLLEEMTNTKISAIPNYRFRPCVTETEKGLPLAMSSLLLDTIKEVLPHGTSIKDNINDVVKIANNIKKEYIKYINSFTWLTPNAKCVLQKKLLNINIEVGYPSIIDSPSELKEYFKDLKLTKNFFANQMELMRFNQNNLMRLLRRPQLYSDWHVMAPRTVSSFYTYRTNGLLFPLGALTHPLYTTYLPGYVTYATVGSFIAHELGHAVDLYGRVRDEYGKVNITLWNKATHAAFQERVNCRVKQYNNTYYHVSNMLTFNEVMADDPSVHIAFMAAFGQFQHINLPPTIINSLAKMNLSPDQFFFLYYAQAFCSSYVPEKNTLGTLKHYPPNKARITATLANTPQFQEVFSCHKGTTMNPQTEDCQIW